MLQEITLHLRFIQLYAHNAHHLTTGSSFFGDHKFLAKLYAAYEEAYDTAAERMIGLKEPVDLFSLNEKAGELIGESKGGAPDEMFNLILSAERVLCVLVEKCFKADEYSQGTFNLLAKFADDSEQRQFLLQQRLS